MADIRDVLACAWSDVWHCIRDIFGRDSVLLWSFIDRWRGGWSAFADIGDVLSCAWSDVWQRSIHNILVVTASYFGH